MWDQSTVAEILDGTGLDAWYGEDSPPYGDIICVVPGRFHADDSERIRHELQFYDRVVLIVTSDEESLFPWWEITHPLIKRFVMTPNPEHIAAHGTVNDTWLGEGVPQRTADALARAEYQEDPAVDWFFSGQITHPEREWMQTATRAEHMPPGEFHGTAGFTQGFEADEYAQRLSNAKVALAPGGPATPDSFRLYEALQAVTFPIAGARTPGYRSSLYWSLVHPDAPFATIHDWANLPGYTRDALEQWPQNAARCGAWWLGHKRKTCQLIKEHLSLPDDENITVVIPTSVIPSHPSSHVIEETVASIRANLPHAEILILCDGVRDEQAAKQDRYDHYLRRLVWLCANRWNNVTPMIMRDHQHQGNLMRRALACITTPLVLFVEHDTPLYTPDEGEIPWASMINMIECGEADVIRLLHEADVLPDYERFMLGPETSPCSDGRLYRKTMQWSQPADHQRVLRHRLSDDDRRRHVRLRRQPGAARSAGLVPPPYLDPHREEPVRKHPAVDQP